MIRSNVAGDAPEFIRPIERAVKDDRVTGLVGTLAQLQTAGLFEDPSLFALPDPARYTRRLIWRDRENRFIIVGLTWLPGQRSPLHDHAGLWGAEIIVNGSMHETTFRLAKRDSGGRYAFVPERDRTMVQGDVGILIPPLEYHDFGNGGDTTSHTIHIYSGNLDHCQAFAAEGDGWWRARRVDLSYDA